MVDIYLTWLSIRDSSIFSFFVLSHICHIHLARRTVDLITALLKSKGPMSQLMDECFLVLLFQNEYPCEPFDMKMSLIGMKMNL